MSVERTCWTSFLLYGFHSLFTNTTVHLVKIKTYTNGELYLLCQFTLHNHFHFWSSNFHSTIINLYLTHATLHKLEIFQLFITSRAKIQVNFMKNLRTDLMCVCFVSHLIFISMFNNKNFFQIPKIWSCIGLLSFWILHSVFLRFI